MKSNTLVEPANTPQPDGNAFLVTVLLSNSSRFCRLRQVRAKGRAQDFGQNVPIRVTLTPDNGPAQTYDAEINNTAANPAEVTVNVTFPVNVLTHVHTWTR